MRCPRCHTDAPRDACPQCGAALETLCPGCQTPHPPSHKFCQSCGQTLGSRVGSALNVPRFTSPHTYTPAHQADKILTARAALEGERRQVTLLFCDLADSTPWQSGWARRACIVCWTDSASGRWPRFIDTKPPSINSSATASWHCSVHRARLSGFVVFIAAI